MINGLEVTCPYNTCNKKYDRVNSFSGHLTKYHKCQILIPTTVDMNIDDGLEVNSENIDYREKDEDLTITKNTSDEDDNDEDYDNRDSFINALAIFYLKLECEYFIPESTIQYIVEELKTLTVHEQERVKRSLKKHLQKEGISFSQVNKILKDVFSDNSCSTKFKELQTIYSRKEFYKSHFHFVWPKKKPLSKGEFFHFVPISETLKALFHDKSLDFNISAPVQYEDGLFKDFTDGSAFRTSKFFKENPNGLRLILYQDGFKVVTPIGPAKGHHELVGVYLAIGNLPDYVRFQKNSIYLVALCKKKNFDHQAVYGEIVEDLKIIESVGINVPGHDTVKGSLVFITGDNLGSHTLGGFVDNFSRSIYFCRYCDLNRYAFFDEDGECKTFERRTVDSYRNCLTKVKVNAETKEITPYHGIKFNSVFNDLLYYHVCNAGLPPCLGHDLMEGVITYDVALFINYLINHGWFTLSELNELIDNFPYSSEDRRDKPLHLKSKAEKVRGGAWQIWTFLRLFPLIIINHIEDKDNEVWQCLLLLTEIVEIVCAPVLHVSHLPYLQTLIQNYLITRRELFPDVPLRPKHHYMSHYPELITIYGPLIKVWTMRFESKHTFFKRALRSCRNFKNITYTLSTKHEFLQCLCRSGCGLRNVVNTSEMTDFLAHMYSESLQYAVLRAHLEAGMQECVTATVKGTLYKKGNVVAVRQDSYQQNVIMGQIRIILCDTKQNIYFVVETVETKFRPHIRAYELSTPTGYECISLNKLLSYYPLHVYTINLKIFVRIKHGFVCTKL
ncbi:uncharacterized protein [Linepithema humile]|uniref:uncharacterized protein isoform X1 n=1 Tax=Linepithema humile TaxID=83485 RepID=UPI00351E6723